MRPKPLIAIFTGTWETPSAKGTNVLNTVGRTKVARLYRIGGGVTIGRAGAIPRKNNEVAINNKRARIVYAKPRD